ncbi:hypothetical protein SAMN05216257_102563 [Meinhardsimonia xiamenensis]|uniref:Uncharacterized protein n=1 Tax=Meinhardsimonia xiamenensis TaxID=990712 RepID=A0A1G9BJK7_9RHOB|nr:hypothetical protein LV81_01556 [Meinhardsimonia xiamenensis]SDK39430.1 hypothetical protein SAMN05216257_102563 [Meinhardsimonia xiamenensis]
MPLRSRPHEGWRCGPPPPGRTQVGPSMIRRGFFARLNDRRNVPKGHPRKPLNGDGAHAAGRRTRGHGGRQKPGRRQSRPPPRGVSGSGPRRAPLSCGRQAEKRAAWLPGGAGMRHIANWRAGASGRLAAPGAEPRIATGPRRRNSSRSDRRNARAGLGDERPAPRFPMTRTARSASRHPRHSGWACARQRLSERRMPRWCPAETAAAPAQPPHRSRAHSRPPLPPRCVAR